jgi:hypothetical protein
MLALAARLPTTMSDVPNFADQFRRAADYADKTTLLGRADEVIE